MSKSQKTELILATAKSILELEPNITLRRLHYLLAGSEIKEIYPNTPKQYKDLSRICTAARKEGTLEYSLFEDNTRAVITSYSSPDIQNFVDDALNVDLYARDRWQDAEIKVELWVEKDGLLSVLRSTANSWQITLRSLHGQSSATAMYRIAEDFARLPDDMPVHILGFFDMDPAGELGIPVSALSRVKDILCKKFGTGREIHFHRLGFNYEDFELCNVESIDGKPKDTLLRRYYELHGRDAKFAECDALPKQLMIDRINEKLGSLIDLPKWMAHEAEEEKERGKLESVKLSLPYLFACLREEGAELE